MNMILDRIRIRKILILKWQINFQIDWNSFKKKDFFNKTQKTNNIPKREEVLRKKINVLFYLNFLVIWCLNI